MLLESSYFDGIKRPWKARSEGSEKPGRLQCNNDMIYTYGPKIQHGEQASVDFKVPYSYELDPAIKVKEVVMANAGVGKGPFSSK